MNSNSILFSPKSIGNVELENRFVRSATYESSAETDGTITDDYKNIYSTLKYGNVGLIITGMVYVSVDGKSYIHQAGLHTDKSISGFSRITDMVHENGEKIFAQLCHGGRQSKMQGIRPPAPSFSRPDMMFQVLPRSMSKRQIKSVIRNFGSAAKRAKEAGFDGVQIHAAHGYLISEFLSPYFNRRRDEWGGDSNKRFNLLKNVFFSIKEAVGSTYPTIVKINVEDFTPKLGLSISESIEHIKKLIDIGVDGIEISCGTLAFSMFNQSRGDVPKRALAKTRPKLIRPLAYLFLSLAYPNRKYSFYEDYNLSACDAIKPLMGSTPLMLVGGLRSFESMERIVKEKKADFISLSRPLIRQPTIIKKWKEGNPVSITCTSCNNCLGGVALHQKLRCNRDRAF